MSTIKGKIEKILLNKEYSWEELADVERDVCESIEEAELPGEYKGKIKILITYENR